MSALRNFLNDVVNTVKNKVDDVKKKVVEKYDDVKKKVADTLKDAASPPTLRPGDNGVWVERLQQLLGVGVDGDFGPKTLKALRAFQEQHQLKADGIAGDQTWAVLRGGAIESPIQLQAPVSLSDSITPNFAPMDQPSEKKSAATDVYSDGKMKDKTGPLPYLLDRQKDLAQASAEAPDDQYITDELNDINRLIAEELERLKQKELAGSEVPEAPADPEQPDYESSDWGDGSPDDPPSSDAEEEIEPPLFPAVPFDGTFGRRNTDENGNLIRGTSRTESREFIDSIVPIAGPAGDAAANFQDLGDAQTDVEALKYGALGLINTAFAIMDVSTLGAAAAARVALKKAGIELAYTGGKEAAPNVARVAGEQALIATQADDVVKAVTPTAQPAKNLADTLTKEEMARRIARLEKRLNAIAAVDKARVEAEKALENLNLALADFQDAKHLRDLCLSVRVTSEALKRAINEYEEYADAILEYQEGL